MKIKPLSITVALIYLGTGAMYSAFAQHVYNEYHENDLRANCYNSSFYYEDTKNVSGAFEYSVKNFGDKIERMTMEYKICASDQITCRSENQTFDLYPGQKLLSNGVRQFSVTLPNSPFRTPGMYSFTVSTTMHGYKNLHTEKTCSLLVMK